MLIDDTTLSKSEPFPGTISYATWCRGIFYQWASNWPCRCARRSQSAETEVFLQVPLRIRHLVAVLQHAAVVVAVLAAV